MTQTQVYTLEKVEKDQTRLVEIKITGAKAQVKQGSIHGTQVADFGKRFLSVPEARTLYAQYLKLGYTPSEFDYLS